MTSLLVNRLLQIIEVVVVGGSVLFRFFVCKLFDLSFELSLEVVWLQSQMILVDVRSDTNRFQVLRLNVVKV